MHNFLWVETQRVSRSMSNNIASSIDQSLQKLVEEVITNDPSWNFVSSVYKTKIAGMSRNVTTTWSKNLITVSLQITIESLSKDEDPYVCRIDVNTWQFWGKKGLKSFKVDEERVDVYWNLRDANFSTSPEPCSDYHVALVYDEDMVLLLGDQEEEACRRSKSTTCLEKPLLVLKEENIFGKNLFTSKTVLGKEGNEHHIVIETAISCENNEEPEMWIGVDVASIRIDNLHWRFRGYEDFLVDGMPVQVLWDVHDWLYMRSNSGSGGIFIFRQNTNGLQPTSLSCSNEKTKEDDDCAAEFCHFLHVWKID